MGNTMLAMVRARRMLLLAAALGAMLLVASASGQGAEQKRAAVDPYWLGPYFAGLRVTEKTTTPSPK